MKLSLKPTDTFFFRDGKPFSRGEQTEASGIFPPFPSTVYGALRTAYISEMGWDKFEDGELVEQIGTKTSHGKFRLKGIFLERKGLHEITYFPLPMDQVVRKGTSVKSRKTHTLKLTDKPVYSSSKADKFLMSNEPDVEYPTGAFLDHTSFKSYLLSEINRDSGYLPIFREEYFVLEPKVGIERELQTPKEKEGNLYRLNMMRLNTKKKYQLLVDVEDIDLPEKGIIKIGGENRPFLYEKSLANTFSYSDEEKNEVIKIINSKKEFKLYCATPTIWGQDFGNEGWKANWMNGIANRKIGMKCELIAAVVGKYENVGGWDIAKGRPKKMFRAVPAGSVYYLKLESGNAEDVFSLFHNKNISDVRANEGFGLTLIGLI